MPKQTVNCSQCNNELKRWLINPNTKEPIKNFFCDNVCKGQWQKGQREALGYTKEWLESEYLTNGKSADQIAREIKRDPKRVWEWIRDYGIPTRPRGTDYGQSYKKGHKIGVGRKVSDETRKKMSDIAKQDGRVPWGKNNKPYWIGLIGKNHPTYKGGLTPERQQFYSSIEWVEVVKKVWERDNAICKNCEKHHNETKHRGTFHIHHIVSFQIKEFRAELDNLVLLCDTCHRWVHSRKNIEKKYIKEV